MSENKVQKAKIEVRGTKTAQVAKLADYRCYSLPILKTAYLKLLNDNISHLIEYIYNNRDKETYQSPEVRVALAMQMIISSDQLIPIKLSTMIAKDLETLRKDEAYTAKWVNPMMKRKRLVKELEILTRHTEIDDSISLNLADKTEVIPNIEDFDIHSGISTLNVSATCPVEEEDKRNCSLM
jgi:hypothetical protein